MLRTHTNEEDTKNCDRYTYVCVHVCVYLVYVHILSVYILPLISSSFLSCHLLLLFFPSPLFLAPGLCRFPGQAAEKLEEAVHEDLLLAHRQWWSPLPHSQDHVLHLHGRRQRSVFEPPLVQLFNLTLTLCACACKHVCTSTCVCM